MAKEPSYPKDAAVGAGEAPGGDSADSASGRAGDTASEGPRRTKHLVAGAAIGIGSAAIVAALLYANRNRKDGR